LPKDRFSCGFPWKNPAKPPILSEIRQLNRFLKSALTGILKTYSAPDKDQFDDKTKSQSEKSESRQTACQQQSAEKQAKEDQNLVL
jgi:hypothetical protein